MEEKQEKEDLKQIAIWLQKRYNGFNEIENITNQLQDALNYDDVVTIRMLIKMRQQEMDNIDGINNGYKEALDKLSESQRQALKRGSVSGFSDADMAKKICEIQEKTAKLIKKLIEQDKKVNLKLAGDKSFYN